MLLRLPPHVFLERCWDDECVVFDTYSGETHHLSPLATSIFRRLRHAPFVDFDLLCGELARPAGETGGGVSEEAIGQTAAGLRHIGLILVEDVEPASH